MPQPAQRCFAPAGEVACHRCERDDITGDVALLAGAVPSALVLRLERIRERAPERGQPAPAPRTFVAAVIGRSRRSVRGAVQPAAASADTMVRHAHHR